jgi:hypothetical protein
MSKRESVEMIVGHDKGKVFLRFKTPQQEIWFDPQNVIDVACAMTDAGFEARDGVKPVSDTLKAELVDRHRMKLTQRVSLMLTSMRADKKKSDGYLAKEIVEAMLKEVF